MPRTKDQGLTNEIETLLMFLTCAANRILSIHPHKFESRRPRFFVPVCLLHIQYLTSVSMDSTMATETR